MLLTMAWRNLSRNRRRSLVTIVAIALGVASVTLFGGYVANVYAGLASQAIHGEKLGHLTIAKQGYFEFGEVDQENYVFSAEEVEQVRSLLADDMDVTLISPRLSARGLVSDGRISTIFIGDAVATADLATIRADYGASSGLESGSLDPENPYGVALAENLAKALDLKVGDSGVIFGATLDGQANAIDFEVSDVYNTGNAATNDKFILLPLDIAQQLLDTQGAERLTVLLTDKGLTGAKRAEIEARLNTAGLGVELRTWEELSSFYGQVRQLFNMIFSFIFSIVVIVALMSIINTMSMVVVERTKEIGTLRALGMQRGTVMRLFSFEGMLLALLGGALGLGMLFLIGGGVNVADLSYTPPNSSTQVPLQVDFPVAVIVTSVLAVLACAVAASILPARKAARSMISESLHHA